MVLSPVGVDLGNVDAIAFSHEHQEHIGGLPAVLPPAADVPVYAPASFSNRFGSLGWAGIAADLPPSFARE